MNNQANLPSGVVLQNLSSVERSAATLACLTADVPSQTADIMALQSGPAHDALRLGAMPVGSVEFIREAMRVLGVTEPANMSYPLVALDLLGRIVTHIDLHELDDLDRICTPHFIKPVRTKLFTGFVFKPGCPAAEYDDHDREQFEAITRTMGDSPITVCISEIVEFAGEWRCYVLDGTVVATARYDPDGADDVSDPDPQWVGMSAAKIFSDTKVRSFSMDVGRLKENSCVLVECNDGWALGLYGKAMAPRDYLAFLWARWSQLAPASSVAASPTTPSTASTSSTSSIVELGQLAGQLHAPMPYGL